MIKSFIQKLTDFIHHNARSRSKSLAQISSAITEKKDSPFMRTEAQELLSKAQYETDHAIKEQMLLQAEELTKSNQNAVDLHYIYIHLIEFYYRQRHTDGSALNKCIEYCKKDIDLFPLFKKAYINEYIDQIKYVQNFFEKDYAEYKEYERKIEAYKPTIPNIPSFKRLAIIYEKQGKYEEAIKICDLAISNNLADDTKGGFEGRRNRILKKINQQKALSNVKGANSYGKSNSEQDTGKT